MNGKELAEHLLRRLAELAEAGQHLETHSLDDLAAEVDEHDQAKVLTIAKALEERGLIMAAYPASGTEACITGEGMLRLDGARHLPAGRRRRQHP